MVTHLLVNVGLIYFVIDVPESSWQTENASDKLIVIGKKNKLAHVAQLLPACAGLSIA